MLKMARNSAVLGAVSLLAVSFAGPSAAQNPAAEPRLEPVFEAIVELGTAATIGDTSHGGRLMIPIIGGTFKGANIKGEVVPGGWDYQLRRDDGCSEIKADYFLKTDDGVMFNVVNVGVLCPPDADGTVYPVRTHPRFEAPRGKYEWLNKTGFIGTLGMAEGHPVPAVKIGIYAAR